MVIHVQNLTKRFGDFTAVNNISFDVPQSQIFGFLGPNGSGKTTTIKILLGLLTPTAGTVEVLGRDIRKHAAAIRSEIGYMSQKFSLYTDLTAGENLRFFGQSYNIYGAQLTRRMAAVIEMFGLSDYLNTLTGELSGGWAQRLALAAAIMHQPRLLFLDEPTAGVDPVSRRQFWNLLYDLAQDSTTIFVTTHYMDEAEHCQRTALLYYGSLIANDAPTDLIVKTVPGNIVVFEPHDPVTAIQIVQSAITAGTLHADGASLFGAAVHVTTTDIDRTIEELKRALSTNGIMPDGWHVTTPSLEDAFIALVTRENQPVHKN